jgi:phage shock protein PspC (stress-responsive transcriptional regulator)
LTRSTDDRLLAGVCGGLADYTGVDPVVFRVAFAAATLLGGAGPVAYVIAWLVIPSAERAESHVEAALGHRPVPRWALVAMVVVAVLAVTSAFDSPWDRRDGFHLPILAWILVGWIAWRALRRDRNGPAVETQPLPVTPGFAVEDHPHPTRRTRPSAQLLGLTVSAVLLLAGVLAAVQASGAADVQAGTALALCLVVVGAALLASAWYGSRRSLLPLAVLLTLATAVGVTADVPFSGGIGERNWDVSRISDLERTYRLGIGEGVLDLRDVELDGRRTVEASIGMGHLVVHLPPDVRTTVRAHAGMGAVWIDDREDGGVDVDRTVTFPGDDGELVLRLRVGMGQIEVDR